MGLRERLFGRKKHSAEVQASGEELVAVEEASGEKEKASLEQNVSMEQNLRVDQEELSVGDECAEGREQTAEQEPSMDSSHVAGQESMMEGSSAIGREPSADSSHVAGQESMTEGSLAIGQELSAEGSYVAGQESTTEGNLAIGQEPSAEGSHFAGQESMTEGGSAIGRAPFAESGSQAERKASAEMETPLADDISIEHDQLSATESLAGRAYDAEADIPADDKNDEGETKVKEKKGFFARLKAGLAKTRDNIVRGIDSVFNGFSAIDDDFYEELEEILIMGDIGVNATMEIVARLKQQVKEQHIKEPRACKQLLIEGIKEQMRVDETAYDFEKQQSVIMVIGVNGVGKTTSVGKLAGKLKEDGRKVLIAAADTFRAAAGDQLAEWARRADVPMVGGNEGADPASVVFDAVNAAKARGVDVLLIDTAGRLHNKKNLMEELRKMNRIIDREFPNAHRENLIVLDGTTGQNALVQAREFGAVAELTGIILTKMDGTAKGGIAVAIQSELRVPVKYIGVGETIDDLQKFDSDEFVNALFDVKMEEDVTAS